MKRALCAGAVAVAALTGCSATHKSPPAAGGSPGSPVSAVANGVTRTEIRIGGIFDKSQFADTEAGAQARINRVNAAGGIYGRKIVLASMIDDSADVNQDNSAAHQLVGQDKVFAVGPVASTTFTAGTAAYLEQNRVPFFGWGITPAWCGNDYGFDLVRCADDTQSTTLANYTEVWAKAAGFASLRGKAFALAADDSFAGRDQLRSFALAVSKAGGSVVYSGAALPPPPAVTGDFTPYATAIMTSNHGKAPDLMFMLATPGNAIGLAARLRELGYKGTILNGALYGPQAAKAAALMTTVLASDAYEDTGNAAIRQAIADLRATSPPTPLSLAALTAYWSVDEFIQILQATGPDLTSQRFEQTLNKGFTFNGRGVFADLTYPAAHIQGLPSCASAVASNGTAYRLVVPFTCSADLPNTLRK